MLTMTVADVLVNEFLKENQLRAALLVSLWALYYCVLVFSGNNPCFAGTFPVFLYLLLRWKACIEMHAGFPQLTQLFVILFALDLVLHGGYWVVSAHSNPTQWTSYVVFASFALGALLVVLSYRVANSRNETPTLALNMAMYTYNFCVGISYLLYAVLFTKFNQPWSGSASVWLTGPIHVMPTAAMIVFRKPFQRVLGQHWLEQRALSTKHRANIAPDRGDLKEVEAVINTASCEWEEEVTLFTLAAYNNHLDAIERLVHHQCHSGDTVGGGGVNAVCSHANGWTPLYAAALRGNAEVVALLVAHGADVNMPMRDGTTPLLVASKQGHNRVVAQLLEAGARNGPRWMGLDAAAVATDDVAQQLRAYESFFSGSILRVNGCACVVSWPGVYAKLWDKLVAKGRASKLSAAVVFCPEETMNYGQCGSDRCYCIDIYGERKPWGCKWFQLWRAHIQEAVGLEQRLQVFYQEGLTGRGQIKSTATVTAWEACRGDALRRDALRNTRSVFLDALPRAEKARLAALSGELRDDSKGHRPGSERDDEEERLFVGSLPDADRYFYEGHKGLGNSQKAEVAWLEEQGYAYEEIDVRDFETEAQGVSTRISRFASS
jgi:hypothetical protein